MEKNGNGPDKNGSVPVNLIAVLLVLAVAMCVFGIFRGEMDTVLHKAANICMECIGIG